MTETEFHYKKYGSDSTDCSRCGSCCTVLPLATLGMDPEYLKYLRTRGLKEEQGFILIPNVCQHLVDTVEIAGIRETWAGTFCERRTTKCCAIHDSPEFPKMCRIYHGQKQHGRARFYRPESCTMVKR